MPKNTKLEDPLGDYTGEPTWPAPGAVQQKTQERQFTIMRYGQIPWSVIAPHEAQALRNQGGQTLERLQERGGLSPEEALAVLEDRLLVPSTGMTDEGG